MIPCFHGYMRVLNGMEEFGVGFRFVLRCWWGWLSGRHEEWVLKSRMVGMGHNTRYWRCVCEAFCVSWFFLAGVFVMLRCVPLCEWDGDGSSFLDGIWNPEHILPFVRNGPHSLDSHTISIRDGGGEVDAFGYGNGRP